MTNRLKREGLFLAVLFLVMMIAGSFWDLPLSLALVDPASPFAVGFAAFGEWPYEFALVFGGLCLMFGGTPKTKAERLIRVVVGGLIAFLAAGFAAQVPSHYLPLDRPLSLAIGTVGVGFVCALLFQYVRKCDPKKLTRAGFVFLLTGVGEVLLIILFKEIWGRPRMGFLMGTPEASFQPWWIVGSSMKETFLALGVSAESFKSFPSGHAGNAACLILFSLLPALKTEAGRGRTALFLLGIAVFLLVAFSRIVASAHFLTDTAASLFVTGGLYVGLSVLLRPERIRVF